MRASTRIGAFVAGLLAVFVAATAVGSLVDPAETEDEAQAQHGGGAAETHERTEERMEAGVADRVQLPAGLAISEGEYTLRLGQVQMARGEAGMLRFSIEDAAARPVTEFDELHERRMHLIVVRRDGSEFRHLHPGIDEAGTWSVPIEFAAAGVYRVFADFSVGGRQHTLASDLFVSGGEFEAHPFPPAVPVASTGGYDVRLDAGEPLAGESSSLTFTVSRDGHEVHDLAPYLGAKGHLVALREGDLAFLHVHPEQAGGGHGHGHGDRAQGTTEANSGEIAFAATFPTAGRYRLYLQFRHDGAVRTAQFTVSVPR